MQRSALPTDTPQAASPFVTSGRWFGPPGRPRLGWLSLPRERSSTSGVVLLPPVGYGYWSSHRALRVLAERLAGQGELALRVDYDGTGDSAGDQWDADRIEAWRQTAADAVTHLRDQGCTAITLLGARLGGTIALLDAAALGADRVVAWSPVGSGRRYVKELRLLSTPVPPELDPLEPAGTVVNAGNVFSAQTLADISTLALTDTSAPPAPHVLVVDDPDGPAGAVVEHLRSLGADVRHAELPGSQEALAQPPEFATVPDAILDEICDWIGPSAPAGGAVAPAEAAARFAWRSGEVSEDVLQLGEHAHVGIVTSPTSGAVRPTTLVFLNPGSETHIGPGRAWVELARDLALLGHRSVRVDFRGWGESPDDGRAPGRPYDACGEEDVGAIVAGLRGAGYERVAILGLCASAWIALRAILSAPVDGVIALNPQMYWSQGDPVEIDWDLIRARRADEIERIDRGQRWRLWTLLDVLGHRSRAARWLDEVVASGVPLELVFADGDDGLIFLRQRLARRLSRALRSSAIGLRELPGVDHPMHLAWLRSRVVEALHESLLRFDAAAPAGR